ncbi:MAG TPA: hypothetical protein PKL84_14085, partial [Candidatus Hydrogenedentes bacterium]|nr:hypothetical protein [Candidatus Hydrogenedentota bacterium]
RRSILIRKCTPTMPKRCTWSAAQVATFGSDAHLAARGVQHPASVNTTAAIVAHTASLVEYRMLVILSVMGHFSAGHVPR